MDTFTADDRFQTMHVDNHDWALQIKYVQMSDAGRYECQVSSDPKISYFVNLTVLGKWRSLVATNMSMSLYAQYNFLRSYERTPNSIKGLSFLFFYLKLKAWEESLSFGEHV